MVKFSTARDRLELYTEIYGTERNPQICSIYYNADEADHNVRSFPDRIEDIKDMDAIIRETVYESSVTGAPEAPNNNKQRQNEEYTLHRKTHIRNVSDTQSFSSVDNTPKNSPSKNDSSLNSNPIPHEHYTIPSNATNYQPPAAAEHSLSPEPHSGDDTIQRSKSDFVPRRKPSLPPLSLSGLKKQSSFHNMSSTNTPISASSNSRRSPLQGFGLFSRPSSRDMHEKQHSSQQGDLKPNLNHPDDAQQQSQQKSHSRTPSMRSMSLNSYSIKNLASSFQSKSNNNRKTSSSSRYGPTTADSYHSHGASNNPFSHNVVNNSNHTPGDISKSVSSSTLGLGIKTRTSSASLASKRFTSSSTNSLSYRYPSGASMATSTRQISKKPHVYPALLSRVATKFKSSIQLGEHKKDGLVYRDAFTGQQAVDCICHLIRTSDRNLALLLGRSLDAQKLFHDVVYEHRLRDSPYEVYEFTDNSRFIGTGTNGFTPMSAQDSMMALSASKTQNSTTDTLVASSSHSSFQSEQAGLQDAKMHHEAPGRKHNINGVFTLLADCYSPTCTKDRLCYSISCPRRLEQQARLNMKPQGGLNRNISMNLDDEEEEKPSWTSSVPKEVWENLSKKEIKRQEAIYEVYSTEKKFVKSLEITSETFMKTLAETNIIPADIRKNFIKHVFAHLNDIYSVNRRFLEALAERQKSSPVVKNIGDILLRFIPFFEPFVSYVASRPYAKYLIETQRSVNPYFARFDDDMMSSSLRHGIDSFLSQGVSRPGRYMLLVKEIIKSSDEEKDKRDLANLNAAMNMLRDFMSRIDKASGAAQDRHDVKLLKQKILFKNEYVNLGLNDERRRIKHEGILSRKEQNRSDGNVAGDIQFYLLDNMLLFLKAKAVNKWHQHKVFQRPIPLPLLFASPGEDMPILRKYIGDKPDSSGTIIQPEYNQSNPKNAITFLLYGAKQKYQVTLYAAQYASLQTLLEKIKQEQTRILEMTKMINITKISDRFFDYTNKINSVASCDGGRKLLIAASSGLYLSNIKRQSNADKQKGASITFSVPVQLVQRSNITQVGVLEEFKSILLLVDKKLYTCPLTLIEVQTNATTYFKKHSKELVNHVNFFAEGDCNGKRLVVTAHSHSVKFFEHEHPLLSDGSGSNSASKKNVKKKITEVAFDSEPVSISFLKANLCIGCKKGFQIVSIFRNAHESLLDPADTSLEFALKDTLKPMAIYRVGNMFLLCYTEFAFFVNNQGWRKKDSHIIHWEGEPQKFAIWYPYILAFDSNFIEIRHIDTGELVRCVLGDKIRLLQTSSQEILYAYEDSRGYDTVATLDFWG